MANKDMASGNAKKVGKTLKEKRVAKHAKADEQAVARKQRDAK
jgi:hypothetical protein